MATKEKSKAVKVPHGSPIPEGMDLDTSDYVNEVGPYDDDPMSHPKYHENAYAGSQVKQLSELLDELKAAFSETPEKVEFRRKVDTKSGLVTALLYFPDGDRFGAQGSTTEEAVTALETKLHGRLQPVEKEAAK
jgi:hypothetical protein